MLANRPRTNGKPPGYRSEQVVIIDRSDETIVITCQLCVWRTCSDDEIPARRDLVLHIFNTHQGEVNALPGSDRKAVNNTRDAHMKWLARRGVYIVLFDIKNL